MIKTKEDLRLYISRDRERYSLNKRGLFLNKLIGGDSYRAIHFLKSLRYCEYYSNNRSKGLYYKFMAFYYDFKTKRLGNKYKVMIGINKCGPGLRLVHLNGGIIIRAKSVGENFTINSGCVVGKKNDMQPTIGNNVDMSVGSVAIGGITIGDNVIIGPNSVVIKDVPSNCAVAGIPAKVIKTYIPPSECHE